MLKESTPSLPNQHRWILEFKSALTSLGGRSKTATPKNVEGVYNIVSDEQSLT